MKVVFSIALFFTLAFSQGQESAFIRTYGSSDFNYGKGIIALADTSYIICGNRSSFGANGSIWLFRVDSVGAFIWETYIDQYASAIVEDIAWYNDTSFVICGTVLINANYQIFAAKVTIDGEILWEKLLGSNTWNYGNSIVTDEYTSIWLTGYSMPEDSLDTDAIIYQLNGDNGDSLKFKRWDIDFSDKGIYIDTITDYLTWVTQTEDINGDSIISTIWKLDYNLDSIWTFSVGNDSVDYKIRCLDQDTLNRIWYAGGILHDTTSSLDESFLFGCIDTNGIFQFSYNGSINANKFIQRMIIDSTSVVYAIGPTHDNGISFGNSDFGVFRDSAGYHYFHYYGEVHNDYGEDLDFSLDGGLVLIGSTSNYSTQVSTILLIKLGPAFEYNDVDHIHYAEIDEIISQGNVIVFPNPSEGIFQLKTELQYQSYQVTDIFGRIIQSGEQINNSKLNLVGNSHGIYFLRLKTKEEIHTFKLLLQ